MKRAYQCDEHGSFVGETTVQEDPLELGAFLLPPGCVLIPPPVFDAQTQKAVYLEGAWEVCDLPAPPTEPPPEEVAPDDVAESFVVPTPANQPETGEHQIAVIVDGRWTVVADWRGTHYWLDDGSSHRITELGRTLPDGARLSPPPSPPTPPLSLADVKAAQVSALRSAYQALIHQPVSFTTAAGHESLFACDADSADNLQSVLADCAASQTFTPDLWLDAGGVPVTPFSYGDLQGLAQTIASRPMPEYQILLIKIAQVMSATSVAGVQSVTWWTLNALP